MPTDKSSELSRGAAPPPRFTGSGGSGFIDIDELRDAHGLVAMISQRKSNGVITIGVFKEFERDGKNERTTFIPEPLFDAFNALSKLAQERVAKIRAEGSEPIKFSLRR